jgi:hypothetical protein
VVVVQQHKHEIGAAYKGGTGDMDYVAHKIACKVPLSRAT